jgi:hypothetical protein
LTENKISLVMDLEGVNTVELVACWLAFLKVCGLNLGTGMKKDCFFLMSFLSLKLVNPRKIVDI